MLANSLAHPKTSIAGVLIAIVTGCAVLQKVDWSHVTPNVVLGAAGALATAFLGLIAKDPSSSNSSVGPKLVAMLSFFGAHALLFRAVFLVCTSVSVILLLSGCTAPGVFTDLGGIISIALSALSGLSVMIAKYAPKLSPVLQEIITNLEEAQKLESEYAKNPQEGTLVEIEDLVNQASADLPQLLQADGVPPEEAAIIETVVSIVASELTKYVSSAQFLKDSTANHTLTITKPAPKAEFKAAVVKALNSPKN